MGVRRKSKRGRKFHYPSITDNLPKFGDGGKVSKPTAQPTFEDSLYIYKKAIDFENKIKKLGYNEIEKEPIDKDMVYIEGFGTDKLKPFRAKDRFIEKEDGWELFHLTAEKKEESAGLDETIGKGHYYLKNLGNNKYKGAESLALHGYNTQLPFVYYDSRITPNETKTYTSNFDTVRFNTYDPIAVKPWSLLTEEEKVTRIQRYGEPVSPRPKEEIFTLEKKTFTPEYPQQKGIIKNPFLENKSFSRERKGQEEGGNLYDSKGKKYGLTDYFNKQGKKIGTYDTVKNKIVVEDPATGLYKLKK